MNSPLTRDAQMPESITVTGGDRIFYTRSGTVGSPTILLLHGLSQQSHYWNPAVEYLAAHHRKLDVVALDQRGHGQSLGFTSNADFSIDRLALDALEVLDALGIDRALVVGHSWGASVALRFSVLFPDRTTASILIDGGAFNPTDMIPEIFPTINDLREALRPPSGPFSEADLMGYYGSLTHQDDLSAILSAISRTYREISPGQFVTSIGIERHMAVVECLMDYTPRPDLAAISRPLVVVRCEEGQNPRIWQLPEFKDNSYIRVINWYGCIHDVPLQRPAMVASLIAQVVALEQEDNLD